MSKIITRFSKILAMTCVYIMCAYMYLTAKGFIFKDNHFVFSHEAMASEKAFSKKVNGNIGIRDERMRYIGNAEAPLTMFDFSSMSCAHCKDFHKYTLPKLKRDFIDQGKLKFVFVHFPLEEMSMRAAKIAYCLPKENFYNFIDKLYDTNDWLFASTEEKLYNHAKEFGMTDQDIQNCKEDKKLTSDILLVYENAIKTFEIRATPSFIVEGKDGQELIVGTKNYDSLKQYLEKRLAGEM